MWKKNLLSLFFLFDEIQLKHSENHFSPTECGNIWVEKA